MFVLSMHYIYGIAGMKQKMMGYKNEIFAFDYVDSNLFN